MSAIGKNVNKKASVSRMKISVLCPVIYNRREVNYYWRALQMARRGKATPIQRSQIRKQIRSRQPVGKKASTSQGA